MKYLASSNLITDLKFKQQVGVKADAHVEALAVINQEEKNEENLDLKINLDNREELQINAKLFLRSFDIDLCLEAVQCLKEAFGVEKIDSLTFSVPAEVRNFVHRGGGSTGAAGAFAPINFQQLLHCTRPDEEFPISGPFSVRKGAFSV